LKTEYSSPDYFTGKFSDYLDFLRLPGFSQITWIFSDYLDFLRLRFEILDLKLEKSY